MPSDHISNEPYHEWLRETARPDLEGKLPYQVVILPRAGGGWDFRVTKWSSPLPNDLDVAPKLHAESDDDLPVALRELYGFLEAGRPRNGESNRPPLAD